MAERFALIAAVFSAIATFLAAWATWRAPLAAAKLAETLRRNAERDQERQKSKLQLFTILMQERGAIYSEHGVRALNLIDIVFNDSRPVREAWAELFHAFNPQHRVPAHAQEERLLRLFGRDRERHRDGG